MSTKIPLKQFKVSCTHDDGLVPPPPLTSAADSSPSRRPTVADHQHSTPLLFASRLRHVSSNFITGVKRSNAPPPSANVNLRAAITPSSVAVLLAEHHHWPRLEKAQPPVRSESATGDIPPADGDGQQELLTELTRSTLHPLTESNRSTQSTQHFQPPASSIPPPNLPKKSFAEVVAPSRAMKTAKTAPHKYFLADSPQPAIGTILTDDQGPKLLFTDAETEVLAAPFRFALVRKFSYGTPSYSMLHKLMAGIGIKNKFTVSMLNNRHVLISLSCESDYTRLWLRRIWYIQGYPMRVFKWTPTFTPSKESSIVPVWVSFPELPEHLFRKEVLFTVANMIGTPLQIDDATLNQSKHSKARACIELDLLKPRLEHFLIQICGATIVQRIDYEDIPHYCSLCKHVGHRDSDCYTEGDTPKLPPRKPSNRAVAEKIKGKKVAEEVERVTKEQVGTETTKSFERGESSRYPTNPSNDDVDSGKHGNDIAEIEMSNVNCDSNVENELHIDNAHCSAHEPADNLVVGENHVVVHDNIISVNVANTTDDDGNMDSAEQLLQELASPARLPRNQFCVDEISEYLVRNTEEKIRVMKQRSGSWDGDPDKHPPPSDDGLSPRPPPRFSVDSSPVSRPTIADRHRPLPLLTVNLLRPISSNFITGTRRSCNSPVSATAALRTAVAPPSRLHSPADHHRSPRLIMAHPPIRSVSATGATPETPPPADGNSQPELLTELTRSTPPLTGSTRSTQ
ncbi:UNVERIFIED_CONTAM: hypothetical protein Sindi_1356300 [Sesamum indicum]